MRSHIQSALEEAAAALTNLLSNQEMLTNIERAADMLAHAFRQKNRVFSCGNGGSMCDAMHFAEELSGRFRLNRPGLPATAISDPSHITCVGNDYGYEQVFARYLQAHGRPGDILLGISTSGTSANVVAAARAASELGMHVIVLTGRPGATLGYISDLEICTPGGRYADRVQELHIKVIHILIELVERKMFPEIYEEK